MYIIFFIVWAPADEGQQADLPPGGFRGQVHGDVPQVHRGDHDGLEFLFFVLFKPQKIVLIKLNWKQTKQL